MAQFYNPPWAVPLLAAVYPFGQAGLAVATMTIMALLIHRLGGGPLEVAAVLVSPPTINLLLYGNIDALALAGLLVPLPLGLVLVSVKPQVAGWAAAYLWARHPRRWWALVPLGAVAVASLAVWGWWPAQYHSFAPLGANYAPWPWLLPVGAWLLAEAWRQEDWSLALVGNVFLWPYWGFYSLSGAVAVLVVKLRWRLGLVVMMAWWVAIIWGMR